MSTRIVCTLVVVAISAPPAQAGLVTYDAQIRLGWSNQLLSDRNIVFPAASVAVRYFDGNAFEIMSITCEPVTLPDIGTVSVHEDGQLASAGTIIDGVAHGTIAWVGTSSLGFVATNAGGVYEGAASGGTVFLAGDTYTLRERSLGLVEPALGGRAEWGNWDHRAGVTRIVFGVPEPATASLLVLGATLRMRRPQRSR